MEESLVSIDKILEYGRRKKEERKKEGKEENEPLASIEEILAYGRSLKC